MIDLNFDCPYCSQNLEVPQDMGGETVECPSCGHQVLIPVLEDAAQPAQPAVYGGPVSAGQAASMLGQRLIHTPPARKGGLGMFAIGLVLFIVGVGLMWFMPGNILICGPLLLLAFILSIVAMAQGSPGSGILLLLLVLSASAFGILRHRWNNRANTQRRETAPAPRRKQEPDVRKEEVPVISMGESAIIDGLRITFHGVRYDTVVTKSVLGRSKRTDEEYMILDVSLESVTDNRVIHLQDIWEKTKLTDDLGNFENAKFAKATRTSGVAGIFSAEISPTSRTLKDVIVFNVPAHGARYFTVEADPYFLERRSGNLIETSRAKIKLHFQAPVRTEQQPVAETQEEPSAEVVAAPAEQEPQPQETEKKPESIQEADLMVESYKFRNARDKSRLTIKGVVRNNSDRDFQNVKIFVSAKDGTGKLLGKTSGVLLPASVPKGKTGRFTVTLDNATCTTESMEASFRFTAGNE